jgi:hypothetical protein
VSANADSVDSHIKRHAKKSGVTNLHLFESAAKKRKAMLLRPVTDAHMARRVASAYWFARGCSMNMLQHARKLARFMALAMKDEKALGCRDTINKDVQLVFSDLRTAMQGLLRGRDAHMVLDSSFTHFVLQAGTS